MRSIFYCDIFFFSSRRRHTRWPRDWSSDVCSSDLMQEALSEDYIVTARAKGLTERAILFKHAFKNASLPLITNAALSFAFILSGAIITRSEERRVGKGCSSQLYKMFCI